MSTLDFENFDYSAGKQMIDELYLNTEVETRTFEDFLNLPKLSGYENNLDRAIVDFTKCVDMSQNTVEDFEIPKPILMDSAGNIIEIQYIDISNNITDGEPSE